MYSCGDSYVIRVYRREETDPGSLIGLVETVENEEKQPFSTMEELWEILNRNKRPVSENHRTGYRKKTGSPCEDV